MQGFDDLEEEEQTAVMQAVANSFVSASLQQLDFGLQNPALASPVTRKPRARGAARRLARGVPLANRRRGPSPTAPCSQDGKPQYHSNLLALQAEADELGFALDQDDTPEEEVEQAAALAAAAAAQQAAQQAAKALRAEAALAKKALKAQQAAAVVELAAAAAAAAAGLKVEAKEDVKEEVVAGVKAEEEDVKEDFGAAAAAATRLAGKRRASPPVKEEGGGVAFSMVRPGLRDCTSCVSY